MILNVVCFKNVDIDAFTQPQFIDIEPSKAAIQLSRALQLDHEGKNDKQYLPLQMWSIGQFDDSTGVFTQTQRQLLLTCQEVIIARKEKDNVRKSKT